jgi:hypothetical protein
MENEGSKFNPGKPTSPRSKESLMREVREVLSRHAGNEARARKEVSALLTKYKRETGK